jgi:hypothetical protein
MATTESSDQPVDDRFRALLEGLRTTIPGVMVLFAFLLTVPLATSFPDLATDERIAFYVAFAAAAAATVLLVAPSVHQRVRAPISGIPRQDPDHVRTAVRLAITGTIAAALAISAVTYFVTTLVFDNTTAGLVAAATAALTAWTWFWLPLLSFTGDGD